MSIGSYDHLTFIDYPLTCAIVVRFVDRDMMMRFFWGLGVGHVYAHAKCTTTVQSSAVEEPEPADGLLPLETDCQANDSDTQDGRDSDMPADYDMPELNISDREDDGWETDVLSDANSDWGSRVDDDEVLGSESYD
jgi:hypothetical protein